MNIIKNTIKFALLGMTAAAMGTLTSCSCGDEPAPVEPPVYVAPDPK